MAAETSSRTDGDDLIRRTYERAAELAARAEADPHDDYAQRWSRIMQRLGDAAVADKAPHPAPARPRRANLRRAATYLAKATLITAALAIVIPMLGTILGTGVGILIVEWQR
jgi:ferric-dicitrate binding protein FerR (iron transport regulator)